MTEPARVSPRLWLRRHWIILSILAIAVMMRVLYLVQIENSLLKYTSIHPETDMWFYDVWARQIARGDVLSARVAPPLHGWHKASADAWLKLNPKLLAGLTGEATAAGVTVEEARHEFAQRAVWVQWMGPKCLYQEPAYPYLVALTYKLFGFNVNWVYAWQMLLGVVGVWLAYRITHLHFGEKSAILAGLLGAMCSPILMHEGLLLRDALIAFSGILLVFLTDRATTRKRYRDWLLLGLWLGFSVQVKATYMFYGMGLFGMTLLLNWRQWKPMAASLAFLLAGAVLMLVPLMTRNVLLGVRPMAITGNNAIPSYIVNNEPDYEWGLASAPGMEMLGQLMGESHGSLLRGIVLVWKEHPSAWSAIRVFICKFGAVWHWWERPDNANIYYYRLLAPALTSPVNFWLVAAPGLVGMAMLLRRFRQLWPLYLLILTSVTPMVAFSVLGRYRLPLLTGLMPFAAYAVFQLKHLLQTRVWRGCAWVATVAVLYAFTGWPLPARTSLYRYFDGAGVYMSVYVPLTLAASTTEQRAQLLADYLQQQDPLIRIYSVDYLGRNADEREMLVVFSSQLRACGLYYKSINDSSADGYLARGEELRIVAERSPD